MSRRIFYLFSGICVLLVSGMVYAWSVFSESILKEYPFWSKASLSLTFTFVMVFFCLGGFAGGYILKRVKPSFCVFLSGVLFFAGLRLASFAERPYMLYVGFGLLCGLGSGLSYNAVMSSVSKWFPGCQGMISGILLMGFGLSSFIIGRLFQSAADASSWRSSFILLGNASSIILLIFSFFIRRPEEKAGEIDVNECSRKEYSPSEMVRMPSFYLYFIWAFLLSAAGLALVSQAGGFVLGVTNTASAHIAVYVGMLSIFNGAGRVLSGYLYDYRGGRMAMYFIDVFFLISTFMLFVAVKCGNSIFLTAGFITCGLAYGGITSLNSAYVNGLFGPKYYPVNFSLINMNLLIASSGSALAGLLLDATKSYESILVMIFIFTLFGILLTFLVWRENEKLWTKEDSRNSETSVSFR